MANVVDATFYERRPLRVTFDIARSWILILASMAVALRWPHPAVLAAAVLVIGCQQYALQILLHDGLHRTLFDKKTTDVVCRVFLCYPLYTALGPFRQKHLDHHKWLGTAEDPDRYYYTTRGKTTKLRFLFWLAGFDAAFAALRSALGRKSKKAGEERSLGNALDWLLVLAVQGAIGAALTLAGGWWAYPTLWFVPFGLGVFIAQSIRSFAEHAQPLPDELADQKRLITYRSNWLERIFIAPNNMNYHAEHHLYPQVPYYSLPRLRRTLEESGEMAPVEYRSSYTGFLWRYFRALPIAGASQPVPSASAPVSS